MSKESNNYLVTSVRKLYKEKLLLIGPLPPPYGGTTIPFLQYKNFLQQHLANTTIAILNSNTGDKSIHSLFHPPTFLLIIRLLLKLCRQLVKNSKIVLFGSQNFCTIIGSFLAIICVPTRKELHIRIIGGGYKDYFIKSSKIKKIMIKWLLNRADSITVETILVFDFMSEHWSNIHYVPNYRVLPLAVSYTHLTLPTICSV